MAVAAEEIRQALLTDTPLYAETCLRIVNKGGHVVPLEAKAAQLKYDAAFEAQRAAGRPMRVMVLKARQWGGSTWTIAKMMQRITQLQNRKAMIVAHDTDTKDSLFGMAETMYAHLPNDERLPLKPIIANQRRQQLLYFANPSRHERQRGDVGLNSYIIGETAGDVQGGRGQTYHYLHCSEVAFWPDIKTKLTGLLQMVPDDPETMIVLESTANGMNEFHQLWRDAEEGKSDFAPVFVAWFEEDGYARPFAGPEERAEFTVGAGPADDDPEWFEDEPMLMELMAEQGIDDRLERLNWRRWAIRNRAQGDLRVFDQEFPSTPEHAFMATGKKVFAPGLVKKMLRATVPPISRGRFEVTQSVTKKVPGGTADVPTAARWVDDGMRGEWSIWEWPQERTDKLPAGQYIVTVDPADPSEEQEDEGAWHAIEVGNHRTRGQCAEYRSRMDEHDVAQQAYLAALLYAGPGHRPWIAVETTGGYGVAIAKIIWQRYRYPFIYTRRPQDSKKEKQEDRLGWSTNVGTKPLMIAGLKEVAAQGTHGVRSAGLAREHLTYVRNDRGKMLPEPGEFADRLMAWAIFHQVAQEKPIRGDGKLTQVASAVVDRMRNPVTGYGQ